MADQGRPSSSKQSPTGSSGRKRATRDPSEISSQQQNAPASNPFSGSSNKRQPVQHTGPPSQSHVDSFQIPALPQAFQQSEQRQPTAAKVAIPRLRQDSNISQTATTEKQRVAHACEPCRHRKSKCSGERPVCKHCSDFKINCVYADGKRDRSRK